MPSAEPTSATLRRDGDTLRFDGDFVTTTIAAVWKQALAQLHGVRRFDLSNVGRVDSAGVALLAELAQRAGDIAIDGDPTGLSALRGAYRLAPALGYAN
jgi:phospholipid transport system transporter-binding protein